MGCFPHRMNLLKTKGGRLTAFGVLYVSEGLPQGFSTVALTMEFKRRGMDDAAIGTFAALIMLPWAWKFLMGPFVDNLHFRRFGARKQWIVAAQVGMLLTLCLAMLRMPQFGDGAVIGMGFFTTLLIVHNVFAATQDVAIDALACQVLKEDERGLANGIMFGGAQVGAAIGGSAVLVLKGVLGGFGAASLIVPLLLFAILIGVITFICEKSAAREMADGDLIAPHPGDAGWQAVKDQIVEYLMTVGRTIIGTAKGRLGFLIALLPMGGMALCMALSTLVAPQIGMSDDEVAKLNLVSSLVWVPCCMAGGWFSDRFGRRLTLGLFSALSVLPGLWMGWQFSIAGWDHPPAGVDGQWPRQEELIGMWWIASMVFSVFNGLRYGISTAFFMDIVNPKIAGTHFTALMAMCNLSAAFANFWQGRALSTKEWNWPMWQIMLVDTLFGLVFLGILPFLKKAKTATSDGG